MRIAFEMRRVARVNWTEIFPEIKSKPPCDLRFALSHSRIAKWEDKFETEAILKGL